MNYDDRNHDEHQEVDSVSESAGGFGNDFLKNEILVFEFRFAVVNLTTESPFSINKQITMGTEESVRGDVFNSPGTSTHFPPYTKSE